MQKLISVFVFLAIFWNCASIKQSSTGTQGGGYSEDLSSLRPSVEEESGKDTVISVVKRDAKTYVEPKYTVNKQLDAVLDSIDRINLTRKFIDGFTIQVYSGLKREEALTVKKDLTTYLPKLETDVQYNQPNFRVKAGKYFNQLEAQKDYQMVKAYFPNAIIVPDKIALKQ